MLTTPELFVLAIIGLLFVLIFATKLKTELIAVLILLTLAIAEQVTNLATGDSLGLVTVDSALSGFSSGVVITLIGLFIITHALEETGVIQWIANQLNAVGQGSELKLMALFMAAGATLSLIMNNVAAGAVLLPAAVRVARISDVPVSRLLMPMSFGTLVGGMATYLTTANILMSELLIENGERGLGMLDFIPVGLVIVLAGLVYMLLLGRHALPLRSGSVESQPQPVDLKATYHLTDQMWLVRVLPDSRLANTSIKESTINAQLGLTIAAIWRANDAITIPKSDQMINPHDELLIIGREDRIQELLGWGTVLIEGKQKSKRQDLPIEPIEIIIAPRSDAIGKTLSQLQFNREYGLLALSLWRDGESIYVNVRNQPLEVGDAVLVVGETSDIQAIANDTNYILPSGRYSEVSLNPEKAPHAIAITAVALLLGMFNIISLPIAMLAGAAAMVVFDCLSMDQFYDAISWRVIFLVAGMLPLSLAITGSGLADRIGLSLVDLLAGSDPIFLVAGMIILTTLVVQIIGGQVTALLVGPIAITAANQVGVDPRAMAVAVAMACSMAFLTPIAHPVNILMMGPAGYKFSDFFVIGLGMTIVTTLAMLGGLMLFWQI